MSEDSTQKWIGRNRPPRVQITYDLETGGADTKKELPLVVGILAGLQGPGASRDDQALPKLKKRKFVEIDRDNFNDVLKSLQPTVTVGGRDLTFTKLDDFRPEAIVRNVPDLASLLSARQKLTDLLEKLDGNDSLNQVLVNVVENTEGRPKLKGWFPAPLVAGATTPIDVTSTAAISVSAVFPATGDPAGGTDVTIAGTGFQNGATVTFGAAAATDVTIVDATKLTAKTPASTETEPVDVTVTNPDGKSATFPKSFTYAVSNDDPASKPKKGKS